MTNNTLNSADDLPDTILEEAAIWQARLRDVVPDSVEQRNVRIGFNQWLLADTRHRQAFAEMEKLWHTLAIPVEQLLAEEFTVSDVNVSLSANSAVYSQEGDKHSALRRHFPWLPVRRLSIAACLALLMLTTFGWQQDWMTQWQSDYLTVVGEEMPISTDDGSRITLNSNSALAMDYSDKVRRVRLLKGEAWFNVAPTDQRPFIVSTDAGEIKVTGTQFNVRLAGDAAVVSLDKGRVELREADALNNGSIEHRPTVLTPGTQAVLTEHRISAPEPFDRIVVKAWLRGQFVFYNTSLAHVVDTLNRYRRGHIMITNSKLNNLKVSGVFSTNDPDAALQMIVNTLPIKQTHLTNYLVLLR